MSGNAMNRLFIFVFIAVGFGVVSDPEAAAESCNRECLNGFITQYIDAMLSHDVASLPLAGNVRFTEDCKEMEVGEGYWAEAGGSVEFRLDIVDVSRGGVFAFLIFKNGNTRLFLALRLKIVNSKITQIETMLVKDAQEGFFFNPDTILSKDLTPMTLKPEEALLNTREEMQAMVVKYPEGLKNGGTFQSNGVPFTAEAFRLENGNLMAGPGCTFFPGCEDIRTQGLPTLPAMVYQVALVDEEAGIVLLRLNFGQGSAGTDVLDVFEAFKAYDDSMHAVFAFMQKMTDESDRSPENLFKWNYDNDVTGLSRRSVLETRIVPVHVQCTMNRLIVPRLPLYNVFTVELFDIAGKMVYASSRESRAGTSVIPLGFLSTGRYIANIQYFSGKHRLTTAPVGITVMK